MKTIEINNKYYREVDVIMLSTNKSKLYLDSNKLYWNPTTMQIPVKPNPQHLYFISNDEIKEGDWYYNNIANKIFKYSYGGLLYDGVNKKVIATTNSSIYPTCDGKCAKNECVCLFPKIPQSFIQQDIDSYNNGNVIEICLVEVEFNKLYPMVENNNIKVKLNDNDEVNTLIQ